MGAKIGTDSPTEETIFLGPGSEFAKSCFSVNEEACFLHGPKSKFCEFTPALDRRESFGHSFLADCAMGDRWRMGKPARNPQRPTSRTFSRFSLTMCLSLRVSSIISLIRLGMH